MQYHLKPFRIAVLPLTTTALNTLVRFNVDRRIEPHAPPFIQTPANLFKFYLCSFTTQASYFRVNWYEKIDFRTISIDSGHELLGSPILLGTRALAVQRQVLGGKRPRLVKIPTVSSNFISKLYVL